MLETSFFAPFTLGRLPRVQFGHGTLQQLPQEIARLGRRLLIISGGSFLAGPHWPPLRTALDESGISFWQESLANEPSPIWVDSVVARFRPRAIDVVVGIGGGSVMDGAKAVAALLPAGEVLDYLEDVGRGQTLNHRALPWIAVPTTAGTGSEATRNAVLSVQGTNGYKKSLRHESMVAELAIIDPALLRTLPASLVAAQGMDAFTQLLESFVSLRANPWSDALAWSGLTAVAANFEIAWHGGESPDADAARAAMAYAALISGMTLAHVGLGAVHGLAQPLGSLFPIPHGVACGTTLAEATRVNLAALDSRMPQSPSLAKYRRVGELLRSMLTNRGLSDEEVLIQGLERWTELMALPRLGEYGVTREDIPRIVAQSRGNSMKSNPVMLTDDEIGAIVLARL
jgi:alcohol dehydrogenase class IV